MAFETKDLFEASLALSVYLSAVRFYGENRLVTARTLAKQDDNLKEYVQNEKDIVKLLLLLTSVTDIFLVITALTSLSDLLLATGYVVFAKYTFAIAIGLLAFQHFVEWIRNAERFSKLGDRRLKIIGKYLLVPVKPAPSNG